MSIDVKLKFRKDIGFTINTFKQSGIENRIGEVNFHNVDSDNRTENVIKDTSKLNDESKILTFDFDSTESIDTIINVLEVLKSKMNKAKGGDDFYEMTLQLAYNC